MHRHFQVRIDNPDEILKAINENKPFIQIANDKDNIHLAPFDIKPPEGYEEWIPSNFPKCCKFHKIVKSQSGKWHKNFPECCNTHREYAQSWWFKKKNYENLANKILTQLSFTEFHIQIHIETDNWFKEITDYIEYNLDSFGSPSIGLNFYVTYLKHYSENPNKESDLYKSKDKLKRIVEYLDRLSVPNKTQITDLNLLHETYKKWLKSFPFELEILVVS